MMLWVQLNTRLGSPDGFIAVLLRVTMVVLNFQIQRREVLANVRELLAALVMMRMR